MPQENSSLVGAAVLEGSGQCVLVASLLSRVASRGERTRVQGLQVTEETPWGLASLFD